MIFRYDMWSICVQTPLGSSSSVTGEEITLERLDRKPAMLTTLNPRKNDEAEKHDQGGIPGDKLGKYCMCIVFSLKLNLKC